MEATRIMCGHLLESYFTPADGVLCTRPLGHLGQHQNWTPGGMRYTWGDDGGSSAGGTPIDESTVYVCAKCGQQEHWDWSIDPVDPTYCFLCNFWLGLLREHGTTWNWMVIEGYHYQLGPATGSQTGFGGQRFIIQQHDGQVITTTNLWTQGQIPEHWLADFPNTARFLQAHSAHPHPLT